MSSDHGLMSRRVFCRGGITLGTGLVVGACATYPDSRLLARDSVKVEMVQRGKGSPAIVLIHGLGDDMDTWRAVIEPASKLSHVVAFNRPGYGKSAWTDGARDAVTVSNEIGTVLREAGIASPVVLVGHSLGGVYAQVHARRFPGQVAGLVLVDTAVPRQVGMIRRMMPAQYALLPALMLQEPAHVRREFRDAETAENQILSFPPYRGGPVVVLAAARGDILSSADYTEARRTAMRSLAAEYGAAFRIVDCGHFIQRDEPGAVAEAVRSVLA